MSQRGKRGTSGTDIINGVAHYPAVPLVPPIVPMEEYKRREGGGVALRQYGNLAGQAGQAGQRDPIPGVKVHWDEWSVVAREQREANDALCQWNATASLLREQGDTLGEEGSTLMSAARTRSQQADRAMSLLRERMRHGR